MFAAALPRYLEEIAVSLLPIILFFLVFQLLVLRLPKRQLLKIAVGLIYTYVGLVLFLTGANVGFMPAGNYLGQVLAAFRYPWILVPIAMIMGYFIVKAEPAVYVLNKQVEEMTDGAISETAMGHALSHRRRRRGGPVDAPGPDGDFDPVASASGIRGGAGDFVFCPEDLYGHCL